MAEVNIKVTQPDEPTVAACHVFEAANPTGPFVEIANVAIPAGEVIEEVTVNATLETDWFAVQWADAAGVWLTPLSPPVKAGGESFVQTIVDRVMQRDRSLDSDIVRQEAEAAIERYFGKNPYGVTLGDIADGKQYATINGLVYLTMARSYLVVASGTSNVQSATLGLVSFRSEAGTTREVDVQALIDAANIELGISTTLVFQMEDIIGIERWWQVTEP